MHRGEGLLPQLSPAQTAGLRSGDLPVAFVPVQHADFQSVAETVVPIVKVNAGKPIDVVVVRLDEVAQAHPRTRSRWPSRSRPSRGAAPVCSGASSSEHARRH